MSETVTEATRSKSDRPTRGLILAGHGSAKNPDTRKPICACIQAMRARGGFDQLHCALWKEEPHFSIALDRMTADDITVVPFFISEGYYTQQVIPREMGLDGRFTRLDDGRVVRLTAPVGLHERFAELIVRRAREAGATGEETLVVLGHGTPRNPNSEKNVYAQAERVREMQLFPEVVTCFLDQEPNMLELWSMTERDSVVMVPLFIADGWHVAETIPEELAEGGVSTRADRAFLYSRAVGTDPGLIEVVQELVDEAATWVD